MAAKYQGISGNIYVLGDKIAGGGEGTIYRIQNNGRQVAKIFKQDKRSLEREEKLRHMVQTKLNGEQSGQVTWPQDVLYDESGFAGYAMFKLEKTEPLTSIYSAGTNNQYDLRCRLLAAINLCYAIQSIHDMGQVCGDLNPQNICVNLDMSDKENAFHVTLVDTDSYHFETQEKIYRCEVGLADYMAPELQKKIINGISLRNAALPTYTKETDLFALAVHIFTLLMNGCHPFACAKINMGMRMDTMPQMKETYVRDSIVAPQPIENIRDGFFPFYNEKQGVTIPVYAPSFTSLPAELQRLFIRTFVNGAEEPSKRVTAQEWAEALVRYKHGNELRNCQKNRNHYYFSHNAACPLCEVELKIRNAVKKEKDGSSDVPPIPSEPPKPTNSPIWRKVACILGIVFVVFILIVNGYERQRQNIVEDALTYESAEEITDSIVSEPPTQSPEEVAAAVEKQQEEEERKAIEESCLNYGNKIRKYIKNKHFKAAIKLIKQGHKKSCFEDKEKLYIKDGKLVSKIKSGKGFVYDIEDDYAYIGEFKNGKADGLGTEIGYPWRTAYGGYYTIKGRFKNGYANGKCTVFYSKYNKESSATLKGSYKNGWENGSFQWIDKNLKGGHSDTYSYTSQMGIRKVIEMYKGNYVYAKAKSGWIYYCKSKGYLKGYATEHHGKK